MEVIWELQIANSGCQIGMSDRGLHARHSGPLHAESAIYNSGGGYPAFSISVIGLSLAITISRVIVTSRTFFWFGT